MSAIQAEVFEAFRAIDVPKDKALRAAAALASAFATSDHDTAQSLAKWDDAFDKLAVQTTSLNAKLTADIAALDGKITSLDGKITSLDGKITSLDGKVAALDGKVTAETSALDGKITAETSALNIRVVKLDGDVALLKWMVGFSLALLVTLLFRSFTH